MGRARSVLGGTSPTGVDACAYIHARARGSAYVCMCALVCEGEGSAAERRAHHSERRTLHTGGSAEYSRVPPCVRRVPSDRIACGRARSVRSRLRVLTAHTARVPAVPREYRVSTVGGAAVKTTYGLIATACVPLLRLESLAAAAAFIALVRLSSDSHSLCDFIRTIIAHCSYSVCGFITVTIAHCAYSVDDLTRIIVSDSCSLCGLIAFKVTDKATACVTL
jgi:hypothetical protein